MKKLLVILLMITYGFSSMGMSVSLNYCCGKLKSVQWFAPGKKDCGMQHKMGSKPCCETKEIKSKTPGDYDNTVYSFNTSLTYSTGLLPIYKIVIPVLIDVSAGVPAINSSPPLSPHPLFIMNCIFRI